MDYQDLQFCAVYKCFNASVKGPSSFYSNFPASYDSSRHVAEDIYKAANNWQGNGTRFSYPKKEGQLNIWVWLCSLSWQLHHCYCVYTTQLMDSPVFKSIFPIEKVRRYTHIYVYMYMYVYICMCLCMYTYTLRVSYFNEQVFCYFD